MRYMVQSISATHTHLKCLWATQLSLYGVYTHTHICMYMHMCLLYTSLRYVSTLAVCSFARCLRFMHLGRILIANAYKSNWIKIKCKLEILNLLKAKKECREKHLPCLQFTLILISI